MNTINSKLKPAFKPMKLQVFSGALWNVNMQAKCSLKKGEVFAEILDAVNKKEPRINRGSI